ncbi:MAG TPA: hypothetical protein V6C81_13080 [Planktothrix sp.]|jgi:hypothetical protein
MRGIVTTVVGTVISLAALAAWFYIAPAEGSGWILFVAFVGSLSLLDSIRKRGLVAAAGVIIAAASGAAWYFHRGLEDAGWVLALAILSALISFDALGRAANITTKKR